VEAPRPPGRGRIRSLSLACRAAAPFLHAGEQLGHADRLVPASWYAPWRAPLVSWPMIMSPLCSIYYFSINTILFAFSMKYLHIKAFLGTAVLELILYKDIHFS
jgi:hypothetical protein